MSPLPSVPSALLSVFFGAALGLGGCHTTEGAVFRSGDAGAEGGTTPTDSQNPDASAAPDAPAVWRPGPGLSWQIQLNGLVDTSLAVDAYDIGLSETEAIGALVGRGRRVICNFSAGSYEPWRSDAAQIPSSAMGKPLVDYPDESWLDVRDATVRQVMSLRMDLALAEGCTGVHPENLDGVLYLSGFPLSRQDQIDFDLAIAGFAHERGLSVGLSGGDEALARALEPAFDWALSYGCVSDGDCSQVTPFTEAGKEVFLVETGDANSVSALCPKAAELGLNALIKNAGLDAFRIPCD